MWKKRIFATACVVFPILAGAFFGLFIVTPYKIIMCTFFVCAVLMSAYLYFFLYMNKSKKKKENIQIEEINNLFVNKKFIEVTLNLEYYSKLRKEKNDILLLLILDTCQEKEYLKFYAYLLEDEIKDELGLFPIFISVKAQDGSEICGEYINYERFLEKYKIKNS